MTMRMFVGLTILSLVLAIASAQTSISLSPCGSLFIFSNLSSEFNAISLNQLSVEQVAKLLVPSPP
jgi:hypothetical protein